VEREGGLATYARWRIPQIKGTVMPVNRGAIDYYWRNHRAATRPRLYDHGFKGDENEKDLHNLLFLYKSNSMENNGSLCKHIAHDEPDIKTLLKCQMKLKALNAQVMRW
jgi:hypothetical protein